MLSAATVAPMNAGTPPLLATVRTFAHEWSRAYAGDVAAIRTSTSFHRIIEQATRSVEADVVLIDVGPNLGAINRAALISADSVLMPLAADLFSLKGLSNLGPALRAWRGDWQSLVLPRVPQDISAPRAEMRPLGYVIMQPEMRLDRPVKAYERWLKRIPWVYASAVLDESPPSHGDDHHQIATLRNYRSLTPLAHDAREPMFDLRPADGALGSTQQYVRTCFKEFQELARAVLTRIGKLPENTESTSAPQPPWAT